MNSKTFIAAVATAVVVTITLSGCGSSTGAASPGSSAHTTAPTVRTSTTIARPSTPVDELVPVHGARLHVQCAGAGKTTVVLIAGFNDTGASWTAVEPTLARTSRVCSYERFGDGKSDSPPAPQTFNTEAVDLRTLLKRVGEPGPYVIVGHSFGGPEAVAFASMFPTDVHGLLLLDASPPAWNTAICAVPADGTDTARVFRDLCEEQSSPARNGEHLNAPAAFAEIATITALGKFPMIVATAAAHPYAGLAAAEQARLDRVWNAGQAHWVSLGASARLVTVDHTGHVIQIDRPEVVLEKIGELLELRDFSR